MSNCRTGRPAASVPGGRLRAAPPAVGLASPHGQVVAGAPRAPPVKEIFLSLRFPPPPLALFFNKSDDVVGQTWCFKGGVTISRNKSSILPLNYCHPDQAMRMPVRMGCGMNI